MCSLHLTHPSAHTPGAVDTHTHTWSSAHTPEAVDTHTHTHLEQCTHTWISGGSSGEQLGVRPGSSWGFVRGAVGGSVPCSRVSPQSWTIPAGAEIRTHNLRLQVQRSIH